MSLSEQHDSRSTEELLQATLQGDEDDEGAWAAIRVLQERGTREVLDAARRLLDSPVAKERGRGADILGQLGVPKRTFPEECGDLLLGLLRREREPSVLASAAVALGHLQESRAVPGLVRLASHPDEDVRLGVVHGLAGQHASEAVAALIQLTSDVDTDVRSWAAFSLGDLLEDVDTPQVRDALAARLEDEDPEVTGEAMVGLAKRKDPRVVEHVRRALTRRPVFVSAVEAAGLLEDTGFLPLLLEVRDAPGEADSYFTTILEEVIAQLQARKPHS